jgi:hypothetical protein
LRYTVPSRGQLKLLVCRQLLAIAQRVFVGSPRPCGAQALAESASRAHSARLAVRTSRGGRLSGAGRAARHDGFRWRRRTLHAAGGAAPMTVRCCVGCALLVAASAGGCLGVGISTFVDAYAPSRSDVGVVRRSALESMGDVRDSPVRHNVEWVS